MYELEEASGDEPEPIIGKFYEEELSAVSSNIGADRPFFFRVSKGELIKYSG